MSITIFVITIFKNKIGRLTPTPLAVLSETFPNQTDINTTDAPAVGGHACPE